MSSYFYHILKTLDDINYKEWCSIREEWCSYKDYIEGKFNESDNQGTLSASKEYIGKFLEGLFAVRENKPAAKPLSAAEQAEQAQKIERERKLTNCYRLVNEVSGISYEEWLRLRNYIEMQFKESMNEGQEQKTKCGLLLKRIADYFGVPVDDLLEREPVAR